MKLHKLSIQQAHALLKQKEISSKEWTTDDINKQKEELGNKNSEYLVALETADPEIFAKKYPQFFK